MLNTVLVQIGVGLFLMVAIKSIIDAIKEPAVKYAKSKGKELDLWWMVYVTWVIGGVLTALTGLDVYTPIIESVGQVFPYPAGLILTAITIGGGSSLVYNIFDKKNLPPS